MASKQIEDEVRRRLADRLRSAGIDEGRVAVEVLYWLPHEFLDSYRELFEKALSLGDGSGMRARRLASGGEDENVVAKVKGGIGPKGNKRGERGTEGSMRAMGGHRYYGGEWIVKDETAMEVKRRVDRRLVRIVQGVTEMVKRELMPDDQEGTPPSSIELVEREGVNLVEASQVAGVGRLVKMRGSESKRVCQDCGRIAKGDWIRCPYSHA